MAGRRPPEPPERPERSPTRTPRPAKPGPRQAPSGKAGPGKAPSGRSPSGKAPSRKRSAPKPRPASGRPANGRPRTTGPVAPLPAGPAWSPLRTARPGAQIASSGGWSPTRRFRLVRAFGLALMVLLLLSLWRGCGSETATTSNDRKPTTTTAPSAAVVPATVNLAVAALDSKLPGATYQGPAAVAQGKVLLLGGINGQRQSTIKAWQFDPASGGTANIATIGTNTNNAASAAVGERVFLYGGGLKGAAFDTIDSVRVGANTRKVAGKLPGPRTGAVAVTDTESGIIYLVGGETGAGPALDVLSSTDGVTFTTFATLAQPVTSPAVAIGSGSIWIFGGTWADEPLATVQQVELASRQATIAAQLPGTLSHAAGFTLRGAVYVAGGRIAAGRTDDVQRFDPTTLTLTPVAKLPAAWSDAAVATIGDVTYLLGGLNPNPTDQIVSITAS